MALNRQRTVPRSLRLLFHGGSLTGLTDGQLLERFAVREVETADAAFAALIDRHGSMVLRTCLAVLRDEHAAHDAFQNTFLVLMRKAGSLWVQDSLGPWLHRVAYHAAARVRRASARRRGAEQKAAERRPERTEGRTWDDLGTVIHQEIERLPERYRIPVVLCDLEERPYEEAAWHLGCPVGTVKSRLARGREHLKRRLERRGLADPAAVLVPGLPPADMGAAVPASLVRDTIHLAIAGAAGGPPRGSIAILVTEVLKAMIRKKRGSIATILFVLSIASFGPVLLRLAHDEPRAAAAPAVGEPIEEPKGDLDAVQGTWIRESTDGRKVEQIIKMVVTKDPDQPRDGIHPGAARFVFQWSADGKSGFAQKVLLDPTQASKTIDFLSDQPGAPKVCPGIYRLEGDTLTICFRAIGGARPEGFVGIKPGEILDVYRRDESGADHPTKPVSTTHASAAGPFPGHPLDAIRGSWLVRGAHGNTLALLNIEVEGQKPRVSLLPADDPKIYRLPESRIESLRIDENSLRFLIRLVSDRNTSGAPLAVDAYIPEDEARPRVLRGSMAVSRSRFPVELERTESKELDGRQAGASTPGSDELRRADQSEDPRERRDILERVLERYGDRPIAPIAAWGLAIALADAHATRVEVRSAAERAIRLAARYGAELEFAAVHRIADHLVASGALPDLALDLARKAESMLQPSDPVALRRAVSRNLAVALRGAGKPEDARAVDDRLSKLDESRGSGGARSDESAGGRILAVPGRRRASPPPDPQPGDATAGRSSPDRPQSGGRAARGRIFAFVHSQPGDESFQEFVAINPEDSTWERLTDDGRPRPLARVSPDGTTLAYSGLERGGVFRSGIRGTDPVQVTDGIGVPLWSPDGKQILVSEVIKPPPEDRADFRWTTWCYRVDGSGRVKLPMPQTGQVQDWSPDGTWLATLSGGMDRLTILRPDGTGARELAGSGRMYSPRFSPDGRHVSFVLANGTAQSLWVAATVGEGRRRLFHAAGTDFLGPACWSPDGKRIAAALRDRKSLGNGGYGYTNARVEILDVTGAGRRPLRLPRWQVFIADWR
jgi:RNA polymerase sigma-70 factor (ECF subfamily)